MSQFSAQPHRPLPHMGADGIAQPSDLGADAPTIPRRDNSFLRFVPSHAGHAAFRSAVTNASNGFPQSRHSYSKRGMVVSLQFPVTANREPRAALRLSHSHRRRPQHIIANGVTVTNDSDHPPVVLRGGCWNSADRFVSQRIEPRSLALDSLDAERIKL